MPFLTTDIPLPDHKLICPVCNGSGVMFDDPCYLCGGAGSTKLNYSSVSEAEIIALVGLAEDQTPEMQQFIIQLLINMMEKEYQNGYNDALSTHGIK